MCGVVVVVFCVGDGEGGLRNEVCFGMENQMFSIDTIVLMFGSVTSMALIVILGFEVPTLCMFFLALLGLYLVMQVVTACCTIRLHGISRTVLTRMSLRGSVGMPDSDGLLG
jgi:hypothetical protein